MQEFLPVYIMALLFVYASYKYYKLNIGKLFLCILLIYTASIICSVFYVHTDFFSVRNKLQGEITYTPFVFWAVTFYIICRPIIQFDRDNVTNIEYSPLIIRLISFIGFFFCLLPLAELLPRVGDIFQSSDLATMLSDAHDDDNKDLGLSPIGAICFSIINYGYPLFLLCILPSLRMLGTDKWSSIRLLFVIFVINFAALILSTRGTLVNTILSLVVLYFIFYPQFTEKERAKITRSLVYLLSSTILIFVIITVMRNKVYMQLDDSTNMTVFFLKYGGEGFINFNQYMDQINHHTDGDYCFYIFKKWLGFEVPETYRGFLYTIQPYIGIPMMVFYTFIGFFVIDVGYIGTLITFLLLSIIVGRVLKTNTNTLSFHNAYLLFFYVSTIANGTCLYKFSWGAGMHVIFMIIVYFLLKLIPQK